MTISSRFHIFYKQFYNMSKINCAVLQTTQPVNHQLVCYVRKFSCHHYLFGNSKMKVNELTISDPSSGDVSQLKELIEMEYNFLKINGYKVPSQITEKDMEALLLLPAKYQKIKYFQFLFVKEKTKAKIHAQKLRKKEEVTQRAEIKKSKETHLKYGRFQNTYLLTISQRAMNRIDYNRLVYASKFEQNIVFDMSYDEYMKNFESIKTASQLKNAYSFNKQNTAPCHIHFCNVNRQDRLYDDMLKHLPNFKNDDFLCNVTEKSFMDTFPRDKLVYLCPDAHQELQNYDHDAIYIIGAYVDKGRVGTKVSLGKAKKLAINMAKLPLDTYLRFKGDKVLTIDQVFKILLTMKNTGKWQEALMHVPNRDLKERL